MNQPTTVVITVEGLATTALSCYGSSWNATPAMDALAATGCVWDRMIATSRSSNDILSSWIGGADVITALESFRQRGSVELFTDSQSLNELPAKVPFDRVELVVDPSRRTRTRPSDSVERTRLGRLVAAVTDRLHDATPPALIWIHTASLVTLWDAPRSLALVDDPEPFDDAPSEEVELLGDDDETHTMREAIPAVFSSVEVPAVKIGDDADPDLVLSWMRTYGCQVRLLDLLIGVLTELEPLRHARFIVAGTSGFNLGQNGWVGDAVGPPRSARLRLPLIVSNSSPLRIGQLTPSDQFSRVLSQVAVGAEPLVSPGEWAGEQDELEPRIETADHDASHIITTPGWFYVGDPDGQDALFLKPDDVDDVNNVASLRLDITDALRRP